MEKQIKRSVNWEQAEKFLLSNLVLEKLDVIENPKTDTDTNKMKREAWNGVLVLFNEVSKHTRTLEQIQSQWRKTKSLAKIKNSAYIRQTNRTSGGAAPEPLNVIEEELVGRLPKYFEIDSNVYDSNSQISETNSAYSPINDDVKVQIEPIIKTDDDEMFNNEDDTPLKERQNPINIKRKKSTKCQCDSESESAKRIKLLNLSIKQKELEMKCMVENHNIQKRRSEMLEIQEKEEHSLRVEKIKLEIEKLKKRGFYNSCSPNFNEM